MTTQITTHCDQCGWTGGPYRTNGYADYAHRRHSCDKHRAEQARAARIEQRRATEGPRRDCRHPNTHHEHGTYPAYVCDQCRCRPCKDAAAKAARDRNRRAAYGQSNLTDAAPVRAHVRQLMAAGVGLKTITRHTGINGGVMSKLMYGIPGQRPPSARVTRRNAALILALDPNDPDLIAPGARVDGTGTRRRLQALVAMGWSINRLAGHLGMDRQRLDGCIHGRDILAATATTIRALYDELWSTPPPEDTHRERISVTRARRHATVNGWVGPLAWDDDTIDDPAAKPAGALQRRTA